jgi:lytic murein transglycosylase
MRFFSISKLAAGALAAAIPPASVFAQANDRVGAVPTPAQVDASVHPLMKPEVILTAAANFQNCLAALWPQAHRRGVSRETFEFATRGLEPDLKIMELLDAQPEFTRPIWDYLDLLVSEERVQRGRELLAQHRAAFDAVERAYGVDRHVLTAIWGIESKYSALIGERAVLRSTATLACVGRRQDYFRDEFLATLEILQRGDVPTADLKGSWAGAFGPTQFMPTAFKRYAVDFDGDGRRDVVNSVPDVLASTANNLKRDGWQPGATWGYEVRLPPAFDYLLVDHSIRKSLAEWERLGVRRAAGKPFPRPADQAYLLIPAGARGPAFLLIGNFRAILRYNPSESYALAVGHLADRIRGGDPIVQAWPRAEVMLSRTERFEMQARLAALGFYRGEPDGRLGARTRAAVRDFQARAGLVPDGFATVAVLERLRRR